MIYLRVHDPWHYYYWKSLVPHLPDHRIHVSPWAAVPHLNRRASVKRTVDWLKARGVAGVTTDLGEDAEWVGSFNFDTSGFGHHKAKTFRLVYAAASKQVQYSKDNTAYDLVLATSGYSQRQLEAVGAKAEVAGYPKLDDYFNGLYTRKDRTRPIVLYAPTCREMSSLARFGKALGKLLPHYELWVQPHPATSLESPKDFDHLRGYAKVLDGSMASPETLFQADVLVTDYSGITFEACAMDKPVVLLDLPEFARATIHHAVEFRDMGERVSDPGLLPFAVDRALHCKSKFSEQRRYYRDLLFENRGTAGATAAKILTGSSQCK